MLLKVVVLFEIPSIGGIRFLPDNHKLRNVPQKEIPEEMVKK